MVEQLTGFSRSRLDAARKRLVDLEMIVYYPGRKGVAPFYEMKSVAAILGKISYVSRNDSDVHNEQYEEQMEDKNGEAFGDEREEALPQESEHLLKQKEKQKEKQKSSCSNSANPFDIFRQNFGILKPAVRNLIMEWCRELGDETVIFGMMHALKKGAQSFSYVEPILKEWKANELKSAEEVEAYLAEKAKGKTIPFKRWEELEDDDLFAELEKELAFS